jgi:hypothetical protein
MDELQQIVNDSMPSDGKIGVVETKVTYIQENDTWGESDQYQQIILTTKGVEYCDDEGTDAFIRMKIGKSYPSEVDICDFWSINGLEDLVRIFNDFQRRSGTNIRYKVTKIVTPEGKDPIIKVYE